MVPPPPISAGPPAATCCWGRSGLRDGGSGGPAATRGDCGAAACAQTGCCSSLGLDQPAHPEGSAHAPCPSKERRRVTSQEAPTSPHMQPADVGVREFLCSGSLQVSSEEVGEEGMQAEAPDGCHPRRSQSPGLFANNPPPCWANRALRPQGPELGQRPPEARSLGGSRAEPWGSSASRATPGPDGVSPQLILANSSQKNSHRCFTNSSQKHKRKELTLTESLLLRVDTKTKDVTRKENTHHYLYVQM